jgi:hypothetical protein
LLKVGEAGVEKPGIRTGGRPVKRAARRATKTKRAADAAPFEHSSRHGDLLSLLEEHTLDPGGPTATSGWLPSRRGNAPRGSSLRET